MQIQGLTLKETTSWQSVWDTWLNNEGIRPEWNESAQKKGWQSWAEWRDTWVKNFDAQSREWLRYEIIDPINTVPNFLIGPTQAWQKNFEDKNYENHSFANLIKIKSYKDNHKINGILKNFPPQTEFIGIHTDNNKIVLIEGHHRATALAIAKQDNIEIHFQENPTIALTFLKQEEENLLEAMLHKGSNKDSL